jgi:hypothetical protein
MTDAREADLKPIEELSDKLHVKSGPAMPRILIHYKILLCHENINKVISCRHTKAS